MRDRKHNVVSVHKGGGVLKDQESSMGHIGGRVVWPFPNQPPEHEPLDKLPFNPDNEEDAPL